MSTSRDYHIQTEAKYAFLELIDVDTIRQQVSDRWFNQTLCRVNDCVVRLGVVQGEFHWHKHDGEDEFFYVIDGRLIIEIQGGQTVELQPNQGYTVPRGVVHRTRALERTTMLMVEGATVTPTGDE